MKKALCIGGGIAGCTAAHQLALMGGWDVTVIERAPFLGAGLRTNWWGGHPYTFGPRHFLTQNEAVYNFFDKYCPLRRCNEHEFLTYIEADQAFYNFPINEDDIQLMPDKERIFQELAERNPVDIQTAKNLEEYWAASVGQRLYEKYVKTYTEKMWMIDSCTSFDTFNWSPKGVAMKKGPRACWDTALSAYPYAADGYNQYFGLGTAEARVLLSTSISRFDIPNKTVWFNGEKHTYDIIINSACPDELFDRCFGELPAIGRDFHKIVLPMEHCFPENVFFLYYANSEEFTRIVEYKKFTKHESPTTLIGLEFPSMNGKYYPIPTKAAQAQCQKYFDLMPDGVWSIGRMGSYRYHVDVDDTIEQMMKVIEELKS